MRLFECQGCGQALYFENTSCVSCGRRLGYMPSKSQMSALEPDGDAWTALADPDHRYRYCENETFGSCNWLVPAQSTDRFCAACRHNRTIPDLGIANNLELWRRLEVAKHRLFYSLIRLKLPLSTKAETHEGLAFDFLSPGDHHVMTGHQAGTITISLSEADDSEREKQRGAMGEPYRTLLGHFRHECAHYYWDVLIRDGPIDEFRKIFGDERADYTKALANHYVQGAPPDWPSHFVSAYASSHPWEDFAETWAHYLHIVDTLETARSFGVRTNPRVENSPALSSSVDFDPYAAPVDRLMLAWLPLTFAVNSINRSMGLNDLYPFVISPTLMVKLAYIHRQIHRVADNSEDIKAMVAVLKSGIGAPH